jgi:hypothetical protein
MPHPSNFETLDADPVSPDSSDTDHIISESARRGTLSHLTDDGNENNYSSWVTKSSHSLRGWGLWKYIEGPYSDPPFIPSLHEAQVITAPDEGGIQRTVIIPSNVEEHRKKTLEAEPWMEANALALSKLVNAAPQCQMHLVEDAKFAKLAWEDLRSAYRPRNCVRATSIRSDITQSRCTPDMDVGQWVNHLSELYSSLCAFSRRYLSETEFVASLIDNMPKSDPWAQFVSNLRDRLADYDETGKRITALEFTTRIKDEAWQRKRDNPNASSQAFSTNSGGKHSRSRPSNTSSTSPSSNKRQRTDIVCTNQYCKSGKGHTIENCFAYCGGKQGRYETWWRGPWNIHLPPDQRTPANNIRPASLSTPNPAVAQSVTPIQLPPPTPFYPQTQFRPQTVPTQTPPYAYFSNTPNAHFSTTSSFPSHYPYYQIDPTYQAAPMQPSPTVQYMTHIPTRADFPHNSFTTDNGSAINFATTNETPSHAWNSLLDGETIVATLPVLDNDLPRADTCHHDSGANRHVFHDRSAFETYQSIPPLEVKGFGHNLSTAAIGRGTVRVNGRYGSRISPLLLHNVLHIPAARSNLISGPQLDLAGISSLLGDGLATLSIRGENIVGGALYNNMYRLNMSIIRPSQQRPLLSRLDPPPLISRITPLAAAASSDQAGFYTA